MRSPSPRRCVVACLLVVLGVIGHQLRADPPRSQSVRVNEAGQWRELQSALDELAWPDSRSGSILLPHLHSEGDLSAAASAFRAVGGTTPVRVFYPAAGPRNEVTRRLATPWVALRLAPGADAQAVARAVGAQKVLPVAGLPRWVLFEAEEANAAFELAARLSQRPDVVEVQPQLARNHARKLTPNDPYFWGLWHLHNTGINQAVAGVDIGVTSVWDTWRGTGMVLGIVDDGVQTEHPDLAPNLSVELSTNFNSLPFDPQYDYHGTLVAGTAAARGNNAVGGTGAAFEATIASIRLLSGPIVDANDAAAMLHLPDVIPVKNNSWGASDASLFTDSVLEGPGPLLAEAFAVGTATGRGGLGNIFVFAGGNGGAYGDDVNYDGYANSVHVIAVGAVDDRGEPSAFSEPGACLTVCAPSGSGTDICHGGRQNITTTDLLAGNGKNYQFAPCDLTDQDYTQNFSGTSAATPQVSGVATLLLQAKPTLGWRDVKEILMRSATRLQPNDPDWVTNSAGIAHHHRLGAGLVNAARAVQLATNWVNLGPQVSLMVTQSALALPVPDADPTGVTVQFHVSDPNFRVEHARLSLWLPHDRYGDVEISLTSPTGITSRLAAQHRTADAGYYGWMFSSVRHWGESAAGTWTLHVADVRPGEIGILEGAGLELFGSVTTHFWMTTTNQGLPVLHATFNTPGQCRSMTFQASEDLASWTDLHTENVCSGGGMVCTDTNAPAFQQRFYRLRW